VLSGINKGPICAGHDQVRLALTKLRKNCVHCVACLTLFPKICSRRDSCQLDGAVAAEEDRARAFA
jgi:hypothetical protein